MPIEKGVYVCSYDDVTIENEEIIKELEKEDAIEVIEGLLRRFPELADIILKYSKEDTKLYPNALRDGLISKHKKENKSLMNF